ncbi:MAG: hypothetical protein ACI3YV_04960 [Prevotella sp.]
MYIIIHKPNIIYNFAPQHLNTSTPQHLNTSTSQHLNISTSQHLNISTSQHLNISTPIILCTIQKTSRKDASLRRQPDVCTWAMCSARCCRGFL